MNHSIQKISLISEKESAKVFLAGETGSSKLYILKEIYGEDLTGLYKQLSKLPSAYLPEIFDVSFHDGTTVLLEEYVEGQTLAEYMKHTKLPFTQVLDIMDQLCSALAPLHNSTPPVVHRDIKPENIILTPEGNLKLIDLDAARIHKDDSDHDTRLIGTRGYASPEQFGFSQTDARSDIYSMGILLQEMSEHCDCPSSLKNKIKKIIDTATMFDPEKRYNKIEDLQHSLQKLNKEKNILLFPCIFMGLCIIALFSVIVLLSGRKQTIINYSAVIPSEHREIKTRSEFTTSFTAQCSPESIFVYLGHPTGVEKLLNTNSNVLDIDSSNLHFYSSDTDTITVENYQLIGWKEGTATIRCMDNEENLLGEWTVAVTTYNDGKDPCSYKNPDGHYLAEITSLASAHANLELAAKEINTLCDMVDFFYAIHLEHEQEELPPIYCPDWYYPHSAAAVLERRQTNCNDVINLAATLLQYDYEDSGIILTCGTGFNFLNWYYEDGYYYCIDYYELLFGIRDGSPVTYPIYRFLDLEDLEHYARNNRVTGGNFYLAILMVSLENHTFMPSNYLSYMRFPLDQYTGPLQVGYEKTVYDSLKILYLNEEAGMEVICIPADEIPECIMTYSDTP